MRRVASTARIPTRRLWRRIPNRGRPLNALHTASADLTWNERDMPERLRAGDDLAFEMLIRRFGGRMLAVARRLLRNEEDARDAVQDALISAMRGLQRFEGE